MKRILLLLSVFASLASAQATLQIPLWMGNRYIYPILGKSLAVTNGVLDVVVVPAKPARKYGALLTQETNGSYKLPVATAVNVVVYRNGMRATETVEYTITGGAIVPVFAWDAASLVVVDYDPLP